MTDEKQSTTQETIRTFLLACVDVDVMAAEVEAAVRRVWGLRERHMAQLTTYMTKRIPELKAATPQPEGPPFDPTAVELPPAADPGLAPTTAPAPTDEE